MIIDDNAAQQLLQILQPYVQRIISAKMTGFKRQAAAIVTGAENEIHYATVRLLNSTVGDETQLMRLMNCSGKPLSVGDNVLLEYVDSLTNAYISIKNDGEPWGWYSG